MTAVARIIKSVGVSGQLRVRLFSGLNDRLADVKSIYIGSSEDDAHACTIEWSEKRRDGTILKLQNINDRTEADALRGLLMFVDDDRRIPLERGTFFVHQIIGLRAIDEDRRELGVITDVLDLPAGDIWVLKREGKEIMVPAVKEFIREVDVEAGIVVLHTIEGLLEGSEG